jgi:hypothetical protein
MDAEIEVKKVESKISDFFKNVAGQFSADELLKVLAGVAGIALACVFFFSGAISIEKAPYVLTVEGVLWAFAFGQGLVGNITKQ